MTGWIKKTDKWRNIFGELTEEGVYEMGPVNYYNLASILEDLYVENAELKERIEKLEKWQDQAQSSAKSVREHIDL